LSVEATPAAAPQNFSVFVVASSATWSERAQLGITVVPALPAWIPWAMILAFILVFISSVVVRKKRTKDSRKLRTTPFGATNPITQHRTDQRRHCLKPGV
jgi:hypothetical protein